MKTLQEHKGFAEMCHVRGFHTNSRCWQNALHCNSCCTMKCKVQFFPGAKAWNKWHFKYFPSLWGVWETYFWVEIPRICLTSPDLPFPPWPTSPAYKQEMRWGTEKQLLADELCPITSSLFLFFFPTNTVCWTKWYAPWQGIWTSGYRPGFS